LDLYLRNGASVLSHTTEDVDDLKKEIGLLGGPQDPSKPKNQSRLLLGAKSEKKLTSLSSGKKVLVSNPTNLNKILLLKPNASSSDLKLLKKSPYIYDSIPPLGNKKTYGGKTSQNDYTAAIVLEAHPEITDEKESLRVPQHSSSDDKISIVVDKPPVYKSAKKPTVKNSAHIK
jgi:hypothetical protein